jgi:hypothetical protein
MTGDGPALYTGGTILTLDASRPVAEAVATAEGRVLAVGSTEESLRALGDRPHEVVDLGPGALLPGFVDAHLHPMAMCFFALHLDLGAATTVADVLDAVADRARDSAFVLGLQVDEERLAERRLPTRDELDAAARGGPVVLLRRDGHTALGNTAALAAAGIAPDAADPARGAFDRGPDGRLTGLCREAAAQRLMGAVPGPDLERLRPAARQAFGRLAAAGITSVGAILQTDAEGPGGEAGALEWVGLQLLLDELPQATHAILCGRDVDTVLSARATPLHDPAAGRRVGGLKLFLDGTLGARTACLHHPYSDDHRGRGLLTLDLAEAARRAEAAHVAGLQVCVHAIGDAAVSRALDLFADLLARHPAAGHGHRVEHASVIAGRDVDRFAELEVAAVVQPLFLRSEQGWLGDRVGPERLRRTYPFRSLLDAGALVAGSSDAPIEDPDVLAGIAAAVTRHGIVPAEAITVEEGLDLYTRAGAAAQHRLDEAGTITPGKRADLVVLAADPRAVPVDRLAALGVERTVVAGRVVHDRRARRTLRRTRGAP